MYVHVSLFSDHSKQIIVLKGFANCVKGIGRKMAMRSKDVQSLW